jgi:NAD(P)-dependent dehydrogenase (short-subunit alcohol dehydrogenase family)
MTDMHGKIVVITGANAGIGRAAAQALVARGAHVVMACRDPGKAEAARAQISAAVGGADRLEPMPLDVADLASVARFAAELRRRHPRVDILVNNAGAWWLDRHELQWATNVAGFAVPAPRAAARPGPSA